MYVLYIVVWPFVLFLFAVVLSALLRHTDYDCPFGIFKLFLTMLYFLFFIIFINKEVVWFCSVVEGFVLLCLGFVMLSFCTRITSLYSTIYFDVGILCSS